MPVAQPLKINVWIDFVCPYCLLGKAVIQEATEGLNVEVEWIPLELRPYPAPTLRPEDDYLPDSWRNGVYPAARQMGIDIKLPTVSPQPYTRAAFLGLQYASSVGRADDYVDAVLKAFFQKDQDIGDISVLKQTLLALGLPPEKLDHFLASPEANALHEAALDSAAKYGIRAVPSLAVQGRVISGMPDAGSLRKYLIERLND